MAGSHLLLVAEDARLAKAIQSHLEQALGAVVPAFSFHGVRSHIGPDTAGLLIAVSGSTTDAQQSARLLQEIHLRQWPVRVVLVETTPSRTEDLPLSELNGTSRLRWPEDAFSLLGVVRQQVGRDLDFSDGDDSSLVSIIGRRLLCQTPSLMPMAERLALASSHDVTVLLTGETGTGKTYLARLVHESSPRKEHRFMTVPCGALAPNLIESEFFGYTKGAFTGADRPKLGKFAAVGRGTLLLDEIDALGLDQQANLLRVIETGEYEPVGSNETQVCTARIVVASNWNLEEAVERGKFRRDLYYRLNVMAFHLPPLRERILDIPPLVRAMAARYAHKFRKDLLDIGPEAMAALEAYPWPGNLRQLENALQQAVLVSLGKELLVRHLPQPIQEYATRLTDNRRASRTSLAENREALERSVIQRTLMSCGYSRSRAANALGISRVTLYKKMKKYDLMTVPLNPGQA